jgi:hypothetical protein
MGPPGPGPVQDRLMIRIAAAAATNSFVFQTDHLPCLKFKTGPCPSASWGVHFLHIFGRVCKFCIFCKFLCIFSIIDQHCIFVIFNIIIYLHICHISCILFCIFYCIFYAYFMHIICIMAYYLHILLHITCIFPAY